MSKNREIKKDVVGQEIEMGRYYFFLEKEQVYFYEIDKVDKTSGGSVST